MILVGQETAKNYIEAGIWGKVRLDSILARIAADRPHLVFEVADPVPQVDHDRRFVLDATARVLDGLTVRHETLLDVVRLDVPHSVLLDFGEQVGLRLGDAHFSPSSTMARRSSRAGW